MKGAASDKQIRALLFLLLSVLLVAIPLFVIGGRLSSGSVSRGVQCPQANRWAEQLVSYLPLGSAYKSDVYLARAERSLAAIASLRKEDLPLEECLRREYVRDMVLASEEWDNINITGNGGVVLSEAFKRIASHQTLWRGIKERSSQPLSVDVVARGLNLRLQKKLVELMSRSGGGADTSESAITNTARLLSCPDCNVIIVSLTTLRKDHVGLYNYNRPTTPSIDEFFKSSIVFNNAFAPTSWTLPNAISLFTSLFPYVHGTMTRDYVPEPTFRNTKISTLAELLSQKGYRTAAFTSGGDYNRQFSDLDRGFDYYLDETTFSNFNIDGQLTLAGSTSRLRYATLRDVLEPGLAWLEKHNKEKFLFFIQGYDTHCPLYPREPYASRFTDGMEKSAIDFSVCHWTYEDTAPEYENGVAYWNVKVPGGDKSQGDTVRFSSSDIEYMRALYDARISETDEQLGRLFSSIRELGLEKNTIVIFMSEHGEMLGENGWFMRGGALRGSSYDIVLNIPLLMKHPAVEEPMTVNDSVQIVDIMPTLLRMLDVTDPIAGLREGKALDFSILGDTPTNEYAYAAASYFPKKTSEFFNRANATAAIRDSKWKLTKNTIFEEHALIPDSISYQLFNIASDPLESMDLFQQEPSMAGDLTQKLELWLKQYSATLQYPDSL